MKRIILFLLVLVVSCGGEPPADTETASDTRESELDFDCSSTLLTGEVDASADARAAGISSYRYEVNAAERTLELDVYDGEQTIIAEVTLRQTFDRNGPLWVMQAEGSGTSFDEIGRTRFIRGTGFIIQSLRKRPGRTMFNQAVIAPTASDHRVRLFGAAADIEADDHFAPTAIWSVDPTVIDVYRGDTDTTTSQAELDAWAAEAGVEELFNSDLAKILNVAWRDAWTTTAYEHALTCELGANLDDRVAQIKADGEGLRERKQALGCSEEEEIARNTRSVSKVLDTLSSITGFASAPGSNFAQNATNAEFGIDAGGGFVFSAPAADIATIVTAATTVGVGASAAAAGAAAAPFALGLAGISAGAYIAARVNDAFGDEIQRAIRDSLNGEPERETAPTTTYRQSRTSADPHFTTLDGLIYDFQNAGEFVFARSKDPRYAIEIQTRQEPVDSAVCPDVAVNTAAAMRNGPHRLGFYLTGSALEFRLDGVLIDLEYGVIPLTNGGLVEAFGGDFTVRWPDGSYAEVYGLTGHMNVYFVASSELTGAIEGLVGDGDGDRENDLRRSDGTLYVQPVAWADLKTGYADSWRVTDATSLFDYAANESTDTFTDLSFPGSEASVENLPQAVRDEAEFECIAAGLEEPYLTDCILDFACTSDSEFIDSAVQAQNRDAAFRRVAPAPPELPSRPGPQSCDEIDRTAVAPLFRAELNDMTLSGTYRVDGRVIFDRGQTVTITPGTVFLVEEPGWFIFGWRNDAATVFMQGTEEAPILFCGTEKRPGHWRGIQMAGGVVDGSQMNHVRIEDAGFEDFPALDVLDNGGTSVLLNNVAISNAGALGFQFDISNPMSDALSVSGSARVGRVTSYQALTHMPRGEFTGNVDDRIELSIFDATGPLVFKNLGVPYHQLNTELRTFESNGDIVVEAGVEHQLCDGCSVAFGWACGNGGQSLTAVGTAEEPIVYTSANAQPTPGIWEGIDLVCGLSNGTTIEHWQLNWGGLMGAGALNIRSGAAVSVSNSSFSNSLGYGIFVSTGETPTLMNNTFSNNAQGDTN